MSRGEILRVSAADFDQRVLRSAVPAVVDFFMDGCAPCEMLLPILERLAADYDRELIILEIDGLIERDIKDRYEMKSFPQLLFFHGGVPAGRLGGYRGYRETREAIEEFAALVWRREIRAASPDEVAFGVAVDAATTAFDEAMEWASAPLLAAFEPYREAYDKVEKSCDAELAAGRITPGEHRRQLMQANTRAFGRPELAPAVEKLRRGQSEAQSVFVNAVRAAAGCS